MTTEEEITDGDTVDWLFITVCIFILTAHPKSSSRDKNHIFRRNDGPTAQNTNGLILMGAARVKGEVLKDGVAIGIRGQLCPVLLVGEGRGGGGAFEWIDEQEIAPDLVTAKFAKAGSRGGFEQDAGQVVGIEQAIVVAEAEGFEEFVSELGVGGSTDFVAGGVVDAGGAPEGGSDFFLAGTGAFPRFGGGAAAIAAESAGVAGVDSESDVSTGDGVDEIG